MRPATTYGRWMIMLLIVLAYSASTVLAQRNITLRLNTATLPDTLDAEDVMQVRGAVQGGAPATLPDGNVIDWGDATTLRPVNVGGDNWEISFQLDDDSTLAFKFYSQRAEDDGAGGWEDGDNHEIAAGTGDSSLVMHYYEKGDDKPYDWRPYESKADSVAVWYRVFVCTADGQAKGYNPSDPAQSLAVRGDPLDGASQLTWGDDTGVNLARESDTSGLPGYDLYSGVAYYPTSAAGMTQLFKFFINGTADGWETGNIVDNRSFVIPPNDSTLRWVYYGDTAPTTCSQQPVAGSVVFSVDTTPLEQIGMFVKARGDTLEVRGGFNGWDCDNPDDCELQGVPGSNIFEREVALVLIPGTTQGYKFFINYNDSTFRLAFDGQDPPSGWEEPISTTGGNRTFEYGGMQAQFLEKRFNDILAENIIDSTFSVSITFSVDMTPALTPTNLDPLVPANDSVWVRLGGDAIWAFTQGLPREGDPNSSGTDYLLTDPDGDLIYTGALALNTPTYGAVQYTYAYGSGGTLAEEQGGGFDAQGRRRTRFITPNTDGSWPETWDFPVEEFQEEGNLPFEFNPVTVGVEVISDEVPEAVWLGANYPNPFNPTTTFEYSIDHAQNVTIRVYDMLGRIVTTLVDGVQPAATYQVTFDAGRLASGVYFYRLETQSKVLSKRMLLIK